LTIVSHADDWIYPARGRIAFGEYALAWLASRTDLKAKSRHQYYSLLTLHVLPTWGAMPLGPDHIRGPFSVGDSPIPR
jgi:hypothetical protein